VHSSHTFSHQLIAVGLQINLHDGQFDNLESLDPSLSWQTSMTSGDYDLSAGVNVAVLPKSDIASLPRSFWGKAARKIGDWDIVARADIQRSDLQNAAITVDAANAGEDLSLKLLANAGKDITVKSIEGTKGFKSGSARVTVTPKYDVAAKLADVTVGYEEDKTVVEVNLSNSEQNIKVSQQVDAINKVAPSFAVQSGKVALEWERSLGEGNSLKTLLKPNEAVEMTW
jgi:hypothetical protein